jgi:hypothetical protein
VPLIVVPHRPAPAPRSICTLATIGNPIAKRTTESVLKAIEPKCLAIGLDLTAINLDPPKGR